MVRVSHPIGIIYEHPQWFAPLFAELDRRGVDYVSIDASKAEFDPESAERQYRLVVNRMSPSAWTRGNGKAISKTLEYVRNLEGTGTPVINGSRAFEYGSQRSDSSTFLPISVCGSPQAGQSETFPKWSTHPKASSFPSWSSQISGGVAPASAHSPAAKNSRPLCVQMI